MISSLTMAFATTASFLSSTTLLTFSTDDMMYYTLTFSVNLLNPEQVDHLIVLSKSKALLESDVVNFIPNTSRSGLEQSLTLIGYSSGFPDIAESS